LKHSVYNLLTIQCCGIIRFIYLTSVRTNQLYIPEDYIP